MTFHRGTLLLMNMAQVTAPSGAVIPGPIQTTRTTVSNVPTTIVTIVNQLITAPPISAPALLATDTVLQTSFSQGSTMTTYYVFSTDQTPPLVVIADNAGIVDY